MSKAMVHTVDASHEPEVQFEGFLENLSRSGKYYILRQIPEANMESGYIRTDDESHELKPFPKAFQDLAPSQMHLSSDDRYLAFNSSFTGKNSVYVVNFPDCDQRRYIGRSSGRTLTWHPSESELYFIGSDGHSLWSAKVNDDVMVTPTEVTTLGSEICHLGFQVSNDGTKFLMLRNVEEPLEKDGLPAPKALLIENGFPRIEP